MVGEVRYRYPRVQPQVWLIILASAGVHAGLVTLLIVAGLMEPKGNDLKDKAMITHLLRQGKERPKNWLPRKPPEAAPAPAPAPAPSAKPAPAAAGSKPAPKSRSADYSKAMAKAMATLNKGEGKPDKEEPEGSPNGTPEGDSLVEELGNAYYTQIYKAVKANYAVPDIISDRERMFLAATVVITIDPTGKILDLSFEKKSGNDVFDSAIANAIRKSAPFPAPPSELAKKYRTEGIGMNFRAAKM